MTDPNKVLIALGFFASASIIVRSFANVLIARAQGQRSLPADPVLEQRLARIEQSVDTIALEVERISEGQRFTTKLLAERGAEHPGVASFPSQPR